MGLILPLIAFGVFYGFNILMVKNGTVNGGWIGFKDSTIVLVSICVNLIPTAIGNNRRWDDFIRGLLVVTMVYCLIWFFVFGTKTLGF